MKAIKNLATRWWQYFVQRVASQIVQCNDRSTAAVQLQLSLTYKLMLDSDITLPNINDVGFKIFSQADEDGILLYIFSIIGTSNKKCVEISAGNGIECNTANLLINHGWTGLLIDCNSSNVELGKQYYLNNTFTYVYPPTFVCAWITKDNINTVLRTNGFEGTIDLLSIDVDGVDYWLWEVLDAIDPRVVVVEYQDIIGPDRSLTIPYTDNFNAYSFPTSRGLPNYCGASLLAFKKLAQKKGYRLVGCNRYCYNAFFIKNDLGEKHLPEVSISECFKHPKSILGMKERFPQVKDLPWVEV